MRTGCRVVPYRFIDLRIKDLRGTYSLKVDTADYKLILSGTFDKPTVKLMVDSTEIRGATFTLEKDLVSISFDRTRQKFRLSGYMLPEKILKAKVSLIMANG